MGGQAVIEGVMMRSPHSFAVAVRRPSGSIVVTQDFLERPSEKYGWLKYPVLRGLGVLGQALTLGIRALRFSAQQAMEDEGGAGPATSRTGEKRAPKKFELSNWLLALNLAISLGFFVFFYKFVPLYLATLLKRHYPAAENLVVFNLVDGVIRMLLFLAFLMAVARLSFFERPHNFVLRPVISRGCLNITGRSTKLCGRSKKEARWTSLQPGHVPGFIRVVARVFCCS